MTVSNLKGLDSLSCSYQGPYSPSAADMKLEEALQNCDVCKIHEALLEGANIEKVTICPRHCDFITKSGEILLENDPELINQIVFSISLGLDEVLSDPYEKEDQLTFCSNLRYHLKNGDSFSPEFKKALIVVIKEFLSLGLKGVEADSFFSEFPNRLSLFEFALFIRDTELLSTLLERGIKPSVQSLKEFELNGLFETAGFTSKSIEIIELMQKFGYSLEDLIGVEDTIESILEEAYEDQCEKMICFFEKNGYRLLSPKEEYFELLSWQKA